MEEQIALPEKAKIEAIDIHKKIAYCNKNRIKIMSAVKAVIAKHTILFLVGGLF